MFNFKKFFILIFLCIYLNKNIASRISQKYENDENSPLSHLFPNIISFTEPPPPVSMASTLYEYNDDDEKETDEFTDNINKIDTVINDDDDDDNEEDTTIKTIEDDDYDDDGDDDNNNDTENEEKLIHQNNDVTENEENLIPQNNNMNKNLISNIINENRNAIERITTEKLLKPLLKLEEKVVEKNMNDLLQKSIELKNETASNINILYELCLKFVNNDHTCVVLNNLSQNNHYLQMIWIVFIRIIILKPVILGITLILIFINLILNALIVLFCFLTKPVREWFAKKIESNLRHRCFISGGELKILNRE